MRPWALELHGRIDVRELNSPALADNALGDSPRRPIWIYLPPGYDDDTRRRYPAIYFLQGFGSFVTRWGHRSMFERTAPELIDGAFADGASPCIVVYVDAWTSLGGSQFLDSPATGRYHTYLCEDVVSYVDENFRTLDAPAHRAVAGHSSGGYGALVSAMLRPDVFGALASHAGDAAFELTVRGDLALAYRALRDRYDGSYDRFFSDFRLRPAMSHPDDFTLVLVWALAACYSPAPDGSVVLPFDVTTGAIRRDVWARWREWDPIVMIERSAEALRSLRGIWIDAGRSDEHLADIAATTLVDELRRVGVEEINFELYDGGHHGVSHRYPLSVRYLAERIAPEIVR